METDGSQNCSVFLLTDMLSSFNYIKFSFLKVFFKVHDCAYTGYKGNEKKNIYIYVQGPELDLKRQLFEAAGSG